MKHLILAALLSATLALISAAGAMAQEAGGIWQTEVSAEGAYLHVQIGPCGYDTEKTCGVIVKGVGTTEDLTGRPIISGMEPAGDGRWARGQIWAPDEDKTYRSKMALVGERLTVEGCVAVFCRGQTWTRVK